MIKLAAGYLKKYFNTNGEDQKMKIKKKQKVRMFKVTIS